MNQTLNSRFVGSDGTRGASNPDHSILTNVDDPSNREEILRLLDLHRERIRSYGVRRLGLFGSIARNEATPASDIDLLVEFERKTFDAYMDLKFFLEEIFQRKVDLVIADAVKPALRPAILDQTVYVPGI